MKMLLFKKYRNKKLGKKKGNRAEEHSTAVEKRGFWADVYKIRAPGADGQM